MTNDTSASPNWYYIGFNGFRHIVVNSPSASVQKVKFASIDNARIFCKKLNRSLKIAKKQLKKINKPNFRNGLAK